MSTDGTHEPSVRYGVKDLLEAMDRKLDGIDSKLDGKVDRSEFNGLAARVTAGEERLGSLERRHEIHTRVLADRDDRKRETFSKREKIGALVIAGLVLFIDAFHPVILGGHTP